VDFYDLDWHLMPFERHFPKSNTLIPKPYTYNRMIELAEILTEGIPFARIDFYEVDQRVFFGEITLYPGSGLEKFTPETYDALLGSWIQLPVTSVQHQKS
jgi:hypothetical protein